MREVRCVCLGSYDPLIDQPVEKLGIGFRFSVKELLVSAEHPDVTQQDDVVFDSRGNAVHDLLRRRQSRRIRHEQRDEKKANRQAAH
jgi:hypothetical protein